MDNKSNNDLEKSRLAIFGRAWWLFLLALAILVGTMSCFATATIQGEKYLIIFAGIVGILLLTFIALLFDRRFRRPTLFFLVCVATLIGLFYAEEDWRGKHDWERFQREWGAKGEEWDWQSLIPRSVPDDQNFALTPVVASTYSQLLDEQGHEKRPHDTSIVNRLQITWATEPKNPGAWTLGKKQNLVVWQTSFRKWAAETNFFQLPATPQASADDVLRALNAYNQPLEDLRQAARLPESRFPLEYDKDNLTAILLPHLNAMKNCSILLSLRAVAELQKNQTTAARSDVDLSLRLIEAIRNEPFLISHLVRVVMLRFTLQPLWEGLADHRWSDEQLAGFEAELAKLNFIADYQRAIHSEMAFQGWLADYVRLHPKSLNEMFGEMLGEHKFTDNEVQFDVWVFPSGWLYQNKLRAAELMLRYFVAAAHANNLTISPLTVTQGADIVKQDAKSSRPFTLVENLMMPGLENSAKKFAFSQASTSMARVAVALERYRLAHGNYPGMLEALAPQFLAQIPNDVINGQPLHYHLEANGQFTLYSVGWNETDDGGNIVLNGGKDGLDLQQGDWVWRYPAQ